MKESEGLGWVKERKWKKKKKVEPGEEREGYINSPGSGR